MSSVDVNETERGGDDIVAAEYVLGVLPAEDREVASRRADREPAFARLVDMWEVYFSPLAAAYAAVEPPASVKHAIDRRLFSGEGAEASGKSLWASLAFWRGLAAVAVAALALYIAVPFINPPAVVPQARYVASIEQAGSSNVHYVALYDAATGEVSMVHTSGDRGPERDFELWMVEGNSAPVSMGVIPVGSTIKVVVPEASRQQITAGVTLAISREPLGGSPTGAPTEVVAAGPLATI